MAETVAILTNFLEFNPGYSLVGIVVDQIEMLAKHGHTVHLFVNEQFNKKYNSQVGLDTLLFKYSDRITIHQKTKFMHLIDFQSASDMDNELRSQASECGSIYSSMLKDLNVTVVFTHDFVFTGWSVPYALAVKTASDQLSNLYKHYCRWFHWIHSVPYGQRDWWDISSYGSHHKLVFPNRTEINRVAESFRTSPSNVVILPHIKDPRSWYDFGNDTRNFLDRYPHIMDADIIQVYPVSTDRMSAKQLDVVIRIFANMKNKADQKVVLIAANQWATGRQRREDVGSVIQFAEDQGLEYDKEFIFTSEYFNDPEYGESVQSCITPKELRDLTGNMEPISEDNFEEVREREIEALKPFARGISRPMLRELQLLSNLLIFPTREESFGLVGPEAALSGALVVTNRSLTMMFEVMGTFCPAFDFGSFHQNHDRVDDEEYYEAVALAILSRMYSNEALMTKTYCRQRYNMDTLYRRLYLPQCL